MENPSSEESSRVNMAYFMLAMLRMGGVLASRTELQDKGVLEVDCPVCLGQLGEGNGFVTFHLLECGHRCEAARTCAVPLPSRHPRACVGADVKVDPPYPRAFPLRVSQGPRGMPAPNRGGARCRRRRRAHVPALPWRVTILVRLCGAWRTDVTWHLAYMEHGIRRKCNMNTVSDRV